MSSLAPQQPTPLPSENVLIPMFEMMVKRLTNIEVAVKAIGSDVAAIQSEVRRNAVEQSAVGAVLDGALFGWAGVAIEKRFEGALDEFVIIDLDPTEGMRCFLCDWAEVGSTWADGALRRIVGDDVFDSIKARVVAWLAAHPDYCTSPTCEEAGFLGFGWPPTDDFEHALAVLGVRAKFGGVVAAVSPQLVLDLSDRGGTSSHDKCRLTRAMRVMREVRDALGNEDDVVDRISVNCVPAYMFDQVVDSKRGLQQAQLRMGHLASTNSAALFKFGVDQHFFGDSW